MISFMLVWAAPSYAQTSTKVSAAPTVQQSDNPETVSLELMGYFDKTLRGKGQTARYPLNLPAEWALTGGGEINLQINSMINAGANLIPGSGTQAADSTLEISFNDVLLEQISLTQSGERLISLTIPPEALVSSREDGRHQLVVRLLNTAYCETGSEARVLIKATSTLTLPHDIVAPPTDLTKLPAPVYQPSFLPNQALLVVPKTPTSAEMSAALGVAAAFGQMSNGALSLSFVPEDGLTTALREESNLIFVGMAAHFSAETGLDEVDFPAAWQDGSWQAASLAEDDGLIQMAVSPWQGTKVVLAVSGQTETAVAKAAQSVGTGTIRVGVHSNLAIVEETAVNRMQEIELPPLDQTLADAGIDSQTFEGESNAAPLLAFSVPANHVATSEAYFDLFFTHSALINYERSGLIVTLNDELVGSVRFSEASTSLTSIRIALPSTAVHSGQNVLAFQSEMESISPCSRLNDSGVWLTIRPESTLHLPLVPGEIEMRGSSKLNQYPEPFTTERPFAQTTFILSTADAAEKTAAAIAFQMGKDLTLPIVVPTVLYADEAEFAMIEDQDLIIIGQPEVLPIIDALAKELPVPFLAESNFLNEDFLPVSYRVSANKNEAYLELLSAPWNNDRTILAVLGNSDEAVTLAGNALINPDIRTRLEGNFAIWDENQLVVETVQPQSVDTAAASGNSALGNLPASPDLPVYQPPSWIMPTLRVSVILMALIAAYVIITAVRRRRA